MANPSPNKKGLMPVWKPGQSSNPVGPAAHAAHL